VLLCQLICQSACLLACLTHTFLLCAHNARNFDKDNIDAAIMRRIQTYTPQPDFQPEKIEKASS
jgi:hypothetical protein